MCVCVCVYVCDTDTDTDTVSCLAKHYRVVCNVIQLQAMCSFLFFILFCPLFSAHELFMRWMYRYWPVMCNM